MAENGATIPLRQGRNIWRLWRTDRDGASTAQVTETVGPAIQRMIRAAGPSEPWEVFRTQADPPTWRIGSARPVVLRSLTRWESGKPAPSMAAPSNAITIAERSRYPGGTLPTVRGQRPWWVLVDLWWRRPDTTIPWPGFAVSDWGFRRETVVQADWVLERGVYVPPAAETQQDPGDQTAASEHGGQAADVIATALPPVAIVLLGAAVLYADAKGWI